MKKLDEDRVKIFKQLEKARDDLVVGKGKRGTSLRFSLDDMLAHFELPPKSAEIARLIRREKLRIINAYDRAKRPENIQADMFAASGWIPLGGRFRVRLGDATSGEIQLWGAILARNHAGQVKAYQPLSQFIADNLSAFARPEFREVKRAVELWKLAFGFTPRIDPLPFDLDLDEDEDEDEDE